MDFVHMPSNGESDQILVIVDRFTKFTILIPLKKTITAEELFNVMWEKIFAIFGIPETMTSDRDKLMRSQKWEELTKELGIRIILSTANHQQTDGQSERKIQEVQQYLRMFVKEQEDWKKWIPLLQFAINDAVSSTTKETPHIATFGSNRKNVWSDGREDRKDLKSLRRQMELEIKWTQERMKEYYDKSRVEAPQLERGDRVYLRRRTKGYTRENIPSEKQSTKLDQCLIGPFKIKKKLGFDNYELWLPPRMRIHPVFHISLLKPTENKPTKEDIEMTEFEVEKIVDSRVKGRSREFKVRWKGYKESEDTWEPEKNLDCDEKVQEFEELKATRNSSMEKLRESAISRQRSIKKLTLHSGKMDQEQPARESERKTLRCYYHPQKGMRRQGSRMPPAREPCDLVTIQEELTPEITEPPNHDDAQETVPAVGRKPKAKKSAPEYSLLGDERKIRQPIASESEPPMSPPRQARNSIANRSADGEHSASIEQNLRTRNSSNYSVDRRNKLGKQADEKIRFDQRDEKCSPWHD